MDHWLPSLNGLRTFEAVARHLSFAKAASELNVSQTAVSHQVKRLEEQLGVRLFDRHGRAVTLTPAAQTYLPGIRHGFDELRRATGRFFKDQEAGHITVSTAATLAIGWLVPRLGAFQRLHPDITVRLMTSPALVDFRREEVDLGIRYGHGAWPGVTSTRLMSDDIFPVCSPGLCCGDPPLREPEDLARHTFLHVTHFPEDWNRWLTAAHLPTLEPARSVLFDQAYAALQAAARGLGVAIAHGRHAQQELLSGQLVRPFHLNLPESAAYYVVHPQDYGERPKVRAFRDWLIETARLEGEGGLD